MTYDELQIGQSASFTKTITEADVYTFADITGDLNPAHMNCVYAETTRFGKPIAHGMLVGSLFSTVFGTRFPGEGSIYISQELNFLAPVFFGNTITAIVKVVEKREKRRVVFECTAINQDDVVVINGLATLMSPKE